MAVTRLRRLKETSGGNKAAHLKKNIFYICNPKKTEDGLYIGGNAGIDPESIYRTIIWNKEQWGKTTKTQGFHYMLCFPPDCKVDENLAFQIAQEFCQELLGEDFYYVFAIHNDKPHLHVHITFDSVSKLDGHKFHSPAGDWAKRIQPITDRLCKKYNLPTLEYDEEKRGVNYKVWEETKRPLDKTSGYTWYDIIRDDIDAAVEQSKTYEEFLEYLQKEQYEIRDGKYLSLKPYGKEKAVRTKRLGSGYQKEEILFRIQNKKEIDRMEKAYRTYGNMKAMRAVLFLKRERTPGWKMSAFQRQFYKRWNRTYFIRKPDRVQTWKYKKDILEVQKLADAIKYMIQFDMENIESLKQRKTELENDISMWQTQVKFLRNQCYRKIPNSYVYQYERLLKKQQENRNDDHTKELINLRKKIEMFYPYETVVRKREELKEEIKKYSAAIKNAKGEYRQVEDIERLFYQEAEVSILQKSKEELQFSKQEMIKKDAANDKGGMEEHGIKTKRYHEDHTVR